MEGSIGARVGNRAQKYTKRHFAHARLPRIAPQGFGGDTDAFRRHQCGHWRPGLAVWERSSMLRTFASLALLLVCNSVFATTGVALVHGTGKQTDAYNDYWQAGMVNSIRQGLPDQSNYVVINCDFNQYMWTSAAAGCLATQLSGFIASKHIDDLVVITHS